ncbi:SET domain-containing protein [Daedalea quercina L-15889]|uniref:SET domain-containing protein n=1 Tax=Daedalea quercina L-15889 TaxID=1314783 RepID=A0A165SIJ6_9APHY|nr:SET domain-containing protein [Daedalea quercina L-15889]
MRQMQKQESSSRASPEGIATHQSFREAATRSNGSRKQSSAIFAACEDERFASHSDHHSRGRPAPTDARQAEEEQDHSEEDAPPAVHWRKRRRGARKETLDEGAYGPPVSPSPSQDGDSEQEIASYLDDPDVEVSVAQTRNEAVPTRRQLRPRNKSRSTAASGCSSHASRSRRSTTSESSSVGPAELSDDFDPSFVEPRIASPSDDPGFEPTSLEAVAKKAGFRMLKWGRDHRQMMKEFANHHVLAKNLPHELQDRINALSPRARKEGNMQVKLFEQAIIENTFEDESNAPPIYIVNDIDDELTPPFEFHYSNLMWHGEGVPKPDVANLRGCGCLGPCDPKSKTCACLARQKQYHPDGFLYQEGRNKGQLKAHDYPIFECNDFCGCSEDCPNRVVQHGRKQAIEIRKTRHKGWGVFNGPKKIPRNTYLGIYAGEYLVEAEAERRGAVYNKFGRTYLFDVDFYYLKVGNDDWSSKYSVDAYHAGNFTRYLNHSCDPNCYINACYINEANLEKPLLTIFTRKDVAPGEELCFSYYGNDEDEDEEPENAAEVRNFDDAVYVQCRCGARNCKGRMWKE